MPRAAGGQVVEKHTQDGITFALRFRAYGRREYVTLGRGADGWTRKRAEVELENVVADVRRGLWQPAARSAAVPDADRDPTLHVFASQWLAERPELAAKTRVDYAWRLSNHLLPFFRDHRLSDITIAEVDRYKASKVAEGDGLSASSINKTLVILSAILESALERELIHRNPAAGTRRRVRAPQPRRTYLDSAEHITALLDAAGLLDAEAAVNHRHVTRRTLLATLVFGGLRIGELLELRWRDVDLAAGRLRIGRAKTAAGQRDVRLRPVLREELATLKARRMPRPEALVFPTSTGAQQNAENVRNHILSPAVEKANERLATAGENPLPAGITPHSLRRTFASLLYALGEPPPVVMAEMGHTHPGLALRIYAQAMTRDEHAVERLRAIVDGSLGTSGGPLGTGLGTRGTSEGVSGLDTSSLEHENPRVSRGFGEADEGTRTLDLLHGKQTL